MAETNKQRFQRAIHERDFRTIARFSDKFATYNDLMSFADNCGIERGEVEELLQEADNRRV